MNGNISNISNKVENKRSYLISLLIGSLALTTGVAMYHGSGSSVSPLSSLVHEQSIVTPSSGFMSTDDFKEVVDKKLGEIGLTLSDVAPVMKAQIDAEKDVLTAYEMANPDVLSFSYGASSSCRDPILDWNFGVGRIFLCVNIGNPTVVDAFIEVAGYTIWSFNINLGFCGGKFNIPSIGLPPIGSVEGTVEVSACGNNRFVEVCLQTCLPWPLGCQNLGCQRVAL